MQKFQIRWSRKILSQVSLMSVAMVSMTVTAANAKPLGNPNAPKKGTMVLDMTSEPSTLNPITSSDAYASQVQGYVIESLLTRNEDTYEWEPALAESFEVSKDGMQATFRLREGLVWSDGKPLTSSDVQFSYDIIMDPKSPTAHTRPYYEGIKSVMAVDPRTVRVEFKDVYFKNFEVAATFLSVIPKHIYGDKEKGLKINKELYGSGPYLLHQYDKGKRIVLKKNPKWWGNAVAELKGQHHFEQLILRFVKEENVRFEMFKKGDLDFVEMRPEVFQTKAIGPEWGKKYHKVKTENQGPKLTSFIAWNLRSELFKDRKVRVALAHLFNRELINQKFLYGMSLPATGPWYQQSEYASKKVKAIPFDPKKAMAIFKEAGWSDSDQDGILDITRDGKKIQMRFTLASANPDTMKYFTMYKEDAKQAGVEIDLKLMEWNSFIKNVDERKFDAVAMSWSGGSVDYDPKQIWHSSSATASGSNFIDYKNPEVDRLIDEARRTMDKKARIPLLQKVYELIAEDAPYAFMFNPRYAIYAHQDRIQKPVETYRFGVGTSYWWLKE